MFFTSPPLSLVSDSYPGVSFVQRSLRFNSADSVFLNRTMTTPTNGTKFTISMWVKRSNLNSAGTMGLFGTSTTSQSNSGFNFINDQLNFSWTNTSGTVIGKKLTVQAFRDTDAWYHLMAVVDTTLATGTDRIKIYVNGNRVTNFTTDTIPTQNVTQPMNSAIAHFIGKTQSTAAADQFFDGYIAEVYFIDGSAMLPVAFGTIDPSSGQWIPVIYKQTYGVNGCHLNFSDNSNITAATLGADTSGNGNNFTPNNFSVTAGAGNDSLFMSPSNFNDGTIHGNYVTLNPTANDPKNLCTLTNGNLDVFKTTTTWGTATTGCLFTTGKWYWEVTAGGVDLTTGVISANTNYSNSFVGADANGWGYGLAATAVKVNNNTQTAYGSAVIASGGIVQVALDVDNGRIFFGYNGTWQGSGDPVAGTNAAFTGLPAALILAISTRNSLTHNVNFGQRAFSFTPPTGYSAPCSFNFPTPSVSPINSINSYKYVGSAAVQSIQTDFKPDFVYIKGFNNVTSEIFDSSRGNTLGLPGTTAVESTFSGVTLDGGGFTIPANTSGVSTTGAIHHSLALKKFSTGFDIVTYTGDGTSNRNINHNLGAAPQAAIIKRRDATGSWYFWHKDMAGATTFIPIESATGAESTTNTPFGTGNWSATQFMVTNNATNNANASGGTYVAYLFRSVTGSIFIGTAVNNNAASGLFTQTGFRTMVVIAKSTTNANAASLIDGAYLTNPIDPLANFMVASTESTTPAGFGYDFTSTGFKIKFALATTLRYIAFADFPFKNTNAR